MNTHDPRTTRPDSAPTTHDTQVVVVGNGPVGQTAALLLARWGVDCIVVDRRAQRDVIGSKAICQQRDVLDVWESVGVGHKIAAEGVTWDRATTLYKDATLFTQPFVDTGRSVFPPFVNISQTRTEELLDEQIARASHITPLWDHGVEQIEQDATGVTLHCRRADGTPVQVRAQYAIVAAGSAPRELRHQLGVTFNGRSFDDKFLICDIRAELPGWERERRFYFDPEWNPGRQVLIHPCPDSTFRIDWQVPGDYDLEQEEASGALDTRIRKIIGDQPYEIVWKSVYRFHSRMVDRMRVGRVLLAGDFAHIVSPFGARGLNTGVMDAENAAWKLAFVLRGWATDDLLDSYDSERRAASRENIEVTGHTMDFLVPHTEEQHRIRVERLTAALTDPSVHPQIDSGRLSEPFWYVDSPLTTPDATRPFAGRPPRGHVPPPAPGVVLPDVPVRIEGTDCTRLRQVARDGLLLLAGSAVDVASLGEQVQGATSAPLRILRIADIDCEGALQQALQARPNEVWVVRPDAHIAAVSVPDAGPALRDALRRAVGSPAALAA
ncbi:MAG TPA: FAD-dependent monooxygenase [Ottowia sp.]|uniref:FAD-dependent monooxygenase n=1 Tax=Ottowia sp. TaxID=1898956 RepID=UPI002D1002ED|nr:FAD-dependent monooxygenase [Ottowia sp.]HMN20517.1 FAD-dependent monooxygenase [Ottowia sp.]